MTTGLWGRLEPLLGQVQEPARDIGYEDGAVTPRHGPGKVAWSLERERSRRLDDVRPAIRSLGVDGTTLVAEVATIGRGLRPAELAAIAFAGAEATARRAPRTHQWIEHDGDRREVLALPAPAPLVGA